MALTQEQSTALYARIKADPEMTAAAAIGADNQIHTKLSAKTVDSYRDLTAEELVTLAQDHDLFGEVDTKRRAPARSDETAAADAMHSRLMGGLGLPLSRQSDVARLAKLKLPKAKEDVLKALAATKISVMQADPLFQRDVTVFEVSESLLRDRPNGQIQKG